MTRTPAIGERGEAMQHLPESLNQHRVSITDLDSVCDGAVRFSPKGFST